MKKNKYINKKINSHRSSRPEVFCKKGILRNFAKFTGKHLCQSLFFNKVAQVFSYEFCEISKNTFFHRTPPVDASAVILIILNKKHSRNWKRDHGIPGLGHEIAGVTL